MEIFVNTFVKQVLLNKLPGRSKLFNKRPFRPYLTFSLDVTCTEIIF